MAPHMGPLWVRPTDGGCEVTRDGDCEGRTHDDQTRRASDGCAESVVQSQINAHRSTLMRRGPIFGGAHTGFHSLTSL
jgi:hypothetical protein